MSFTWALWGIWAAATLVLLAGTALCLIHFSKAPPHLDAPFGLYPVSILKPLCGANGELEANLRSFLNLDYPEYEVIFSVARASDPAAALVRRLLAEPRGPVGARLLVGDVAVGPNPKVNNLLASYEAARYPLLLISDSNVRAPRDYLRRLVGHLEDGVGMVTAVVAGAAPRGPAARLEACYLNTFYARWMLLAAAVGRPCVVGKSMLFLKSTAERFGGLRTLAPYLAEDFMAGEATRALNLRIAIATDPVLQPLGALPSAQFWNRHLRWGRIRKSQAPLAFVVEPCFGTLFAGGAGAAAWYLSRAGHPLGFLAAHLTLAYACDSLAAWRIGARSGVATRPSLAVWLQRETLSLPLWCAIALSNRILWHGNRMQIRRGGLITAEK